MREVQASTRGDVKHGNRAGSELVPPIAIPDPLRSLFPLPRKEGARRRCGDIVKRPRRPEGAGKATLSGAVQRLPEVVARRLWRLGATARRAPSRKPLNAVVGGQELRWAVLVVVTIFAAVLVGVGRPGVAQLVGHGGFVKSVAVSKDGRTAITAGFDYRLILWDLADQSELRDFQGHEAPVNSVAFLADGRRAVSSGDDGTLRLWDLASGALLHTFEGHEGKVAEVAVSPDGRLAASAGWDRSVRLWIS